ncbi:hypothetical protein M1M96_00030 [Peptococcaceae bacterium]|nr:hypothetical protein [Peptococcaceae bacterium]
MKKLLLIFLAAVLMLPLYTQSAAASIIEQINQAMERTYGPGFDKFRESVDTDGDGVGDAVFNQDLFNTRGIIVYGEPFEFDEATEHNRYLGYTYLGEKYTNTFFRHDAFAGGRFRDRNWLREPEREPAVIDRFGRLERCRFTEAIRQDPDLRDEIEDAALLGMFKTSHFEEAETFKDIHPAVGIIEGVEGIDKSDLIMKAMIEKIEDMREGGIVNAATNILADLEWTQNLADYIY